MKKHFGCFFEDVVYKSYGVGYSHLMNKQEVREFSRKRFVRNLLRKKRKTTKGHRYPETVALNVCLMGFSGNVSGGLNYPNWYKKDGLIGYNFREALPNVKFTD